jgi:hypothetical protein
MPAYTKLFNSIVTSTIWTEDDKTRIVWITMLAMSDKNGEVHASIPGLARVAGVSVPDCENAISKLLSPDDYSRTPDFEGRRIAPIDGGWELLNHAKYRLMASREDAKAATAARVKRHRARKSDVTPCNGHVTVGNAGVTVGLHIADTDTDTERREEPPYPPNGNRNRRTPPTIREAIAAASEMGVSKDAAEYWWNTREASDWRKGTAGGGTTPVGNWRSDLAASKGWASEQAAKAPKNHAPKTFSDEPIKP